MIPLSTLELVRYNEAGTTVLDRIDLTDWSGAYALASWGPAIAPRRPDLFGGRGPYADVQESITLHVLGDTPAGCADNTARLATALDQAGRWYDGEEVGPVVLRARIQASALNNPVESTIYTLAGENALAVQPEYDVPGWPGRWINRNVTISLWRLGGLWLNRSSTQSDVSSGASGGNLMAVDFGAGTALETYAPTDVQIDGYATDSAGLHGIGRAYLAIAPKGKLWISNVQSFTTETSSGGVLSTVSSAEYKDGSARRNTASGAGVMTLSYAYTSGLSSDLLNYRLIQVYAGITSTRAGTLTLILLSPAISDSVVITRPVAAGQAAPLDCGIVAVPSGVSRINLFRVLTETGSASDILTMDYLLLIDVSDPETMIMRQGEAADEGQGIYNSATIRLAVAHKDGVKPEPRFTWRYVAAAVEGRFGYSGDIALHTREREYDAVLFGRSGNDLGSSGITVPNNPATVTDSWTVTLSRHPAYLVLP